MPEVKNYRVLDGCHNCANMRDASTYDEHIMLCLLRNPELKDISDFEAHWHYTDAHVDEHGTCDEWKRQNV
jgi:hypothetical protein